MNSRRITIIKPRLHEASKHVIDLFLRNTICFSGAEPCGERIPAQWAAIPPPSACWPATDLSPNMENSVQSLRVVDAKADGTVSSRLVHEAFKMSMLSAAALLDELMGVDRDRAPNEKKTALHWSDPQVSIMCCK